MGYVLIPLTQGQFTTIDPEDVEKVCQFKWTAQKRDGQGGFYAIRGRSSRRIWLHRELTNCPANCQVDHINGDGLDNRQKNLRIVRGENGRGFQRKARNKTSQFRGVSWARKMKIWVAGIQNKGTHYNLGSFIDERDAARAYDAAARSFGFFPEALNFPNE